MKPINTNCAPRRQTPACSEANPLEDSSAPLGSARQRQPSAAERSSADSMMKLAAHLFGAGKLSLSLNELAAATSFSKRTIRRAEIRGQLVALKLTRTKNFLISDVLDWLQRIR